MNIDNIKEVQAKSNKIISEIHLKNNVAGLETQKRKKI